MKDLDYRYFYEVAKTLNFTTAAEKLYISQPALSRCISKLEEEFGAELFIRSNRDVRLTNAGVALLNNYPKVQIANRLLYESVQNVARGMDSELLFGIQGGHLISTQIKEWLQGFAARYPNIGINVISLPYNDLFDQLNDHGIDIAFSLNFPNNFYPNILQKKLKNVESCALVSKDHPAAACTDPTRALCMLDGLDLMLVAWTIVPNVTSYIINQCTANNINPANVRYAPSYQTLYNWLIMEKGFVIMDRLSLFHESDIAFIPLQHDSTIDFCAYWHKESANPAVLQFTNYLSELI